MKYYILTFKLSGQVDLPRRQIETWKYSPHPVPPRSHAAWYRNSPNKESIFELDCNTVSLAAGWNDLTFQLNWKTALCMLADMGRETV